MDAWDTAAYNTLEQMRIYLKLNHGIRQFEEEYKQVEIIFNALILAIGNPCYKNLLRTFLDTNRKISGVHGKSLIYWRDYVRYMDVRMKAPPPGSLIRFSGLPEDLEQTPPGLGLPSNPVEQLTEKYF